jgi:Zn-dependent peptidase ImmA (M78 family)
MVRRKFIQVRARSLLQQAGVRGAPVPVDTIAKILGATITIDKSDDDALSGFLLRDIKHRRVVIGVNSSHHPHRRRFTIAHEIGHLVLHKGDGVHVDSVGAMFRIDHRNADSAKGTSLAEREANLFAAELLMPAAFVERAARDVALLDEDAIAKMAKQFEVSSQALAFRLAYLGFAAI